MPRPRLAPVLCASLVAVACSDSSPTAPPPPPLPDAGQTVAVGQNGLPRFVTPGAAAGMENQVTVNEGATVTWRFMSGGYNVISGGRPDGGTPEDCLPDGVFCSPGDQGCDGGVPPQPAGTFYQRTFVTVGDYPYFSQPGCLQGMSGVVHVHQPPADGGAGP
ncbi:MAG TPA: hypothetical protein VFR85_05085 [Anaeromyxobacteraceae bacterium]|nr:hypothetical protein [Anaeromyxobacteraceae bacterium]